MGSNILILAAMLPGILSGGLARCEPVGEPKPWYAPGLAHFVAVAASARLGTAEIQASLVVGRNGADTMQPGPMVLVPWSHGPDCKPLAWTETRDGVWSPPLAAAFYAGRLRDRTRWVNGVPTVDIEMARLQPLWHGGEADRQRFGPAAPLLTPLEFFEFYRILPTSDEFDARAPQALSRVEGWEATHQELAAREPVRSMLRWLRMVWKRDAGPIAP